MKVRDKGSDISSDHRDKCLSPFLTVPKKGTGNLKPPNNPGDRLLVRTSSGGVKVRDKGPDTRSGPRRIPVPPFPKRGQAKGTDNLRPPNNPGDRLLGQGVRHFERPIGTNACPLSSTSRQKPVPLSPRPRPPEHLSPMSPRAEATQVGNPRSYPRRIPVPPFPKGGQAKGTDNLRPPNNPGDRLLVRTSSGGVKVRDKGPDSSSEQLRNGDRHFERPIGTNPYPLSSTSR